MKKRMDAAFGNMFNGKFGQEPKNLGEEKQKRTN